MFCFTTQCNQHKTFEKPRTRPNTRPLMNRKTGIYSLSIMNLLSITKVPVSSTINLLEESISVMGFWSLNHLMDGLGFPEA